MDEKYDSWYGKHYNIVVTTSKRPQDRYLRNDSSIAMQFYIDVTLENINGCCTGQAWFTTKEGELLLLPWWRIIAIEPVEVKGEQ